MENEFLARSHLDLHQMHLFQLVARNLSFTRAAEKAGLTQSAVSRQIRNFEDQLGHPLLIRSTRKVELTDAGEFLLERIDRVLQDIGHSIELFAATFPENTPRMKLGVSTSIGLAYLPGFFHRFRNERPDVQSEVHQLSCREIMSQLQEGEIDIGIVTERPKFAQRLQTFHQFPDPMTLIAPRGTTLQEETLSLPWIQYNPQTATGTLIEQWLHKNAPPVRTIMQLDDFDLIVHLVSLGLGASMVPNRSLAPYRRNRKFSSIPLSLERKIFVLSKGKRPPEHMQAFIDLILF